MSAANLTAPFRRRVGPAGVVVLLLAAAACGGSPSSSGQPVGTPAPTVTAPPTTGAGWSAVEPALPPCQGVAVTVGGDVAAAAAHSPAGATLCLAAGAYVTTVPIRLKAGDTLEGAGRTATVITASGAPQVITAHGASGVTVEGLAVTGATGTRACKPQCGVGLLGGPGTVVFDVHVYGNVNHGIGGGMPGGTIRDSEIDHNGFSPDFAGCCNSGIKGGSAFTIENSYVHDNTGPGVWCDVGCGGGTTFIVRGNLIASNSGAGVRYEISAAPTVIEDNVFLGNNTSGEANKGSVNIVGSANVTVAGNTFEQTVGGQAVTVTADGRGVAAANIKVTGNRLNAEAVVGCTTTATVQCAGNH